MNTTHNRGQSHPQVRINALTRGATISETVRAQIKQYILDRGLKAGDPLPPETQWAQELGVNRSSVREAVKALESLGLVEIRHGQGLFVRERNFDHLLETLRFDMELDPSTLLQLAEIRTWLELAVLPEALDKMGSKEIESMEIILKKWKEGFQTTDAEEILSTIPNIDVLWGMYDEMALGGLEAIKARGLAGKISVMGYDNTPDAYAAIKRGEMHVTVDTAPKEMGYNLIHAIKKYVMDGEMVPKVIRSEIAIWDRSNVDRFDTDNYYHAPMKEKSQSDVGPSKIPGLAPAWVTAEGQFRSFGSEVSTRRTGREPLPTRKLGPVRIGFIPTAKNTHYDIVIAGALTAIDELGGPKVIDLNIHFPSHQSAVAEQIRIVQGCIERRYDALAVCTADDRAMTPVYQKAAEFGIPVFLFNTPLTASLNPYYISNVGYDQREAGRLVGLWLTQHFGNKPANVAILEGLPGMHNDERLDGFKDGIVGNDNIKIVASQAADWLRDKGQVVIDQVFQFDQDRQFHRALYSGVRNDMLTGLLNVFWTAFGNFLLDFPGNPEADLSDHVEILEALKARDLDRARQALSQNLLRMQERVRYATESTYRL
jgi:ABC-type sugar transport system substrate-binding protein/DNA-binding transcriptional regulator YhcF (GntR family)